MVDYRSKVSIGVLIVFILAAIAVVFYVFVLNPKKPQATAPGGEPAIYELVWNGTENEHVAIDDFKSFMANSDQPILVDFWAEWCGPCRSAAPTIEALAQRYAGQVHVVKINTDYASDTANDFNVTGIPYFVVINNGKVVDSVTGFGEGLDNTLSGMLDAALA